jgi:hypothetical protein
VVPVVYRWTGPTTLGDAAGEVGHALGLTLAPQDSSYYGGDYFLAELDGCEIRVIENFIEDDGEAFEPELPEGAIFVVLDGPESTEERVLEERLLGVPHLVRAEP